MNDLAGNLGDFLAHMGIAAEVRPDAASESPLIVIATELFHQRRARIEAWFILLEEFATYSYFYVRPRGTGDTK